MQRRNFLRALIALPIAAAAAPLDALAPLRLKAGGIVPHNQLYLVGSHRCTLPVSTKIVPTPPGQHGITVEISCDTEKFSRDLEQVQVGIRKFQRHEIARIFGINASLIGEVETF
jgi:hypothetical protein